MTMNIWVTKNSAWNSGWVVYSEAVAKALNKMQGSDWEDSR